MKVGEGILSSPGAPVASTGVIVQKYTQIEAAGTDDGAYQSLAVRTENMTTSNTQPVLLDALAASAVSIALSNDGSGEVLNPDVVNMCMEPSVDNLHLTKCLPCTWYLMP